MQARANMSPQTVSSRETSQPPVLDLLAPEIPHLRRWARHLARDPDLADDMVQECLLRAVTHAGQWCPGSSVRAWLFAVLKNAFISDRRQAWRRMNMVTLDSYREPSVPADQESHMDLVEVRRAFERLNQEHQEVLFTVTMEGMAYDDAAVALDVPVGTIRSRLSRARAALKREVDGDESQSRRRARRA